MSYFVLAVLETPRNLLLNVKVMQAVPFFSAVMLHTGMLCGKISAVYGPGTWMSSKHIFWPQALTWKKSCSGHSKTNYCLKINKKQQFLWEPSILVTRIPRFLFETITVQDHDLFLWCTPTICTLLLLDRGAGLQYQWKRSSRFDKTEEKNCHVTIYTELNIRHITQHCYLHYTAKTALTWEGEWPHRNCPAVIEFL